MGGLPHGITMMFVAWVARDTLDNLSHYKPFMMEIPPSSLRGVGNIKTLQSHAMI